MYTGTTQLYIAKEEHILIKKKSKKTIYMALANNLISQASVDVRPISLPLLRKFI